MFRFIYEIIPSNKKGHYNKFEKNLLHSCDKPMVKCLSAKSIKDDDSQNNERGVFTLSVVKIETKPNCNCRKNEYDVL